MAFKMRLYFILLLLFTSAPVLACSIPENFVPSCKSNEHFDVVACACIENSPSPPANQCPDADKTACTPGSRYDFKNCKCEGTCPDGSILDLPSNTCVPAG